VSLFAEVDTVVFGRAADVAQSSEPTEFIRGPRRLSRSVTYHLKRGIIMTKRTSIIMGGMAAAVALTAAGVAGAATTPLYSGGGTLAEKVYRDLFNTYGNTASGDLCVGRPTANCPVSAYNANVEILYVGVGSGNGLKAIDNNDPSLYVSGSKKPDAVPVPSTRDFGPFYGTGTGSTWAPGTGVGPNFPKVSFSGSDNSLSATDVSTAKASPLGNNPLIQFPGLVTAIAVPFNPAPNWAPHGVAVGGASSTVQFSTNTLCGIFTGAITKWDDAAIKADNHGVTLGTGTITVVYRHDGSGTTFLFTNALLNQCGTSAHPTKSTHPVPDQWLTDNGITANGSAPFYKSGTSFYINVFTAGHLPSNFYNDNGGASGVTGGASGSGGVKAAIIATTGSIGYLSPDFVKPVDTSGPAAANLQTYDSFSAGTTPSYRPPTANNAVPIMSSSKPPSFPTAAANPLNWGALNPTPTGTQTYPIGGFTFIDLHRCFTSAGDVAALAGTTPGSYGYFTWYYGPSSVNAGKPAAILKADGFAPVPAAWASAITRLLTAPATGLNVPGTGACKYVAHGA
jgi:ABC-type phosphate transport system substrate-binding protein